jgi:hypothetical protein
MGWLRELIIKWMIKSFPDDVMKGRYGKMVMKIWAYLNGKKTAIGLLLVVLGDLLEKMPGVLSAFGADAAVVGSFTKALGWIITGLGALHKVLK